MLVCTTHGSRTYESNVLCTICGARTAKGLKDFFVFFGHKIKQQNQSSSVKIKGTRTLNQDYFIEYQLQTVKICKSLTAFLWV